MFLSDQILLLPEDVLAVIGGIRLSWARTLRNYAKKLIAPLLGFQLNWEKPELDEDDGFDALKWDADNKVVVDVLDSEVGKLDGKQDNVEEKDEDEDEYWSDDGLEVLEL